MLVNSIKTSYYNTPLTNSKTLENNSPYHQGTEPLFLEQRKVVKLKVMEAKVLPEAMIMKTKSSMIS